MIGGGGVDIHGAELMERGQEVSFLGRLVLYFLHFTVGSLPFASIYIERWCKCNLNVESVALAYGREHGVN